MELQKIIEEVARLSGVITGEGAGDFPLADYDYNLRANQKEFWIEFFGFKSWMSGTDHSLTVKEVFRAVCYRYGIVFIDRSSAPEIEE